MRCEGSLFNVSPLSPGLVVWPTREGGAAPSEGVLSPAMLEDFDDSVLGDPITYARMEQLPGSESPLSLPVYAWPPSSTFLNALYYQTYFNLRFKRKRDVRLTCKRV